MTFSPTDSRLFAPLFRHSEVGEIFSDEGAVRVWMEVETALARAQSRLGLIPAGAEVKIAAAAAEGVDFDRLRAGTEAAGFPIIELLRQLRARLDDETASYLHWGATTQDIMDTALVLQIREALKVLERGLKTVIRNLARLADRHRNLVMAGRTHSQQALPVTFGLKAAGWLAPLLRHLRRLEEMRPRLLVVQFGGAAGTLAALGSRGPAVQEALASELNLKAPLMPWHSQRDRLCEAAGWLSLVSGSLGKMGQDVILLAQSEIGEVRESPDLDRGGSSTMPQKSNPIQSELIVAAARFNATLLASMHQSLIQEHERGTHGWQLEWLTLPQMFGITSGALHQAGSLSRNLVVDAERMERNVRASQGLMLAEAAGLALAPSMGLRKAKGLVTEACRTAAQERRHLLDVLRERSDAPVDWEALKDESNYCGAANSFIDRVLREADSLL